MRKWPNSKPSAPLLALFLLSVLVAPGYWQRASSALVRSAASAATTTSQGANEQVIINVSSLIVTNSNNATRAAQANKPEAATSDLQRQAHQQLHLGAKISL